MSRSLLLRARPSFCQVGMDVDAEFGPPSNGGASIGATHMQRATAAALATHWLQPFKHSGIRRSALRPSRKNRRAEDVLCPVLQVVGNRIYIIAAPEMRQLDMQLHRCDAGPVAGDTNRNYCPGTSCRRLQRVWERHRFQVALRLLRIAVERGRLPDFELRLCLDDTCALHCSHRPPASASRSCDSVGPAPCPPPAPCTRVAARAVGVTACGSNLHVRVQSSPWPPASTRPRFQWCNGTCLSGVTRTCRCGTTFGAAGHGRPGRP